jgi:hypothetical protein
MKEIEDIEISKLRTRYLPLQIIDREHDLISVSEREEIAEQVRHISISLAGQCVLVRIISL